MQFVYIDESGTGEEPAYDDEIKKVANWSEMILSRAIPKSNIIKSRGRCECSELYYNYAPEVIR